MVIKTIGYNQHEMIKNIVKLHCVGDIDCDLTYSKGNFYKHGLKEPEYKFDLSPQTPETIKASSEAVPLPDDSVGSVMFDPPFVVGSCNAGKPGVIKSRFGYFKNIPELWWYYKKSLKECYRILRCDGVLIFKCQDVVSGGKNYFTHNQVMNDAIEAGFYPKDLFILLAKTRLISPNMINQQHARKFHCYFWVFKKENCKVDYQIIPLENEDSIWSEITDEDVRRGHK